MPLGKRPIEFTCEKTRVEEARMITRDCEGMIRTSRRERTAVIKAAVLALIIMFALPVVAGTDRAVKNKVPPVYPELAKRMKISGVVKIEATVDADGKVTGVKSLSGNVALQGAAEEAVRKWKFVPGEGTATVEVEVAFAMGQ
jgi:TonB family protein